jgi:hypothetical protein
VCAYAKTANLLNLQETMASSKATKRWPIAFVTVYLWQSGFVNHAFGLTIKWHKIKKK